MCDNQIRSLLLGVLKPKIASNHQIAYHRVTDDIILSVTCISFISPFRLDLSLKREGRSGHVLFHLHAIDAWP